MTLIMGKDSITTSILLKRSVHEGYKQVLFYDTFLRGIMEMPD